MKQLLNTLIIDDEPIALEKLRSYVEKSPALRLAGQCTNGVEAAAHIATGDIDLIFTDINMPDLNGIDFISSLAYPPLVIFTTAYSEYAVESYRLKAVDYLLKPYSFADFSRAANRALEEYNLRNSGNNDSPDSIFVKVDSRYIRLSTADILYIKGYGEYLQLYHSNSSFKTPLLTLSSFSSILERLPDCFMQVHRSYVVNMTRLDQIERNRIIIGDSTIPVGDSYRSQFLDYIAAHSVGGKKQ